MVQHILELTMIVSRSITKRNLEYAKKVMKETHAYYDLNKGTLHRDIVAQTLDVLVKNYGEMQFKIPYDTDICREITYHLNIYLTDLNKFKKTL